MRLSIILFISFSTLASKAEMDTITVVDKSSCPHYLPTSTTVKENGEPVGRISVCDQVIDAPTKEDYYLRVENSLGKRLFEGAFNAHLAVGHVTQYYAHGPISHIGKYTKGLDKNNNVVNVKTGVWKHYDHSGILRMEATHLPETKEEIIQQYDINGNPTTVVRYKDGKQIHNLHEERE